tara:strand:- start:107 stop:583 length:477 start_codon:yes stop_codon:yes gene_type:complete
MNLEIERRFLIANDKWKEFISYKTFIEQGYLSYDLDGWIIRIRFDGDNFKIALKKHIKNFTSYEFEYPIPSSEGEKIMSTLKNTVKKERYILEIDQKEWIIDCFKGKNYPLKIAEIELQQEKEEFTMPKFLSKEITGIRKFSNLSLSNHPFSQWNHNE